METNVMKMYEKYMEDSSELRVGVYEVRDLASICGISSLTLVLLGKMANEQQTPVQFKKGWYIYSLEERISEGKQRVHISIDNSLKYL